MSRLHTTSVTRPGLAPLPLLAPGTYSARQVLTFVIRVIEEEPKRLHMGNWVSALLDMPKASWATHRYRGVTEHPPACGTVCCVAGWICVVAQPGRVATDEVSRGLDGKTALRLLGLDDRDGWSDTRDAAGRTLERIFYSTDANEHTIVPALRAFVLTYRALLSHIQVVVR